MITTPTEKLETMSITGDEPNEFSFSDGALAYVGHHGAMLTGSPSDQMHVAIVDAATFTVKKRIPMIASATVPGYVDIGSGGRPGLCHDQMEPDGGGVRQQGRARVAVHRPRRVRPPGTGWRSRPTRHASTSRSALPRRALAVVDVKTLTVVANIVDTDLIGPRLVRFPHY